MVTAQVPMGRVVEQYRRALRYHCYQMLGSLADAEDLTQETISRALARGGEFEGRADVKTWLFRIATHACIDELRSARRRKLVSTTPANGPEDGDPSEGDVDAWVQPFPDALLPEHRVARVQAVTLAFVAALQWLPARQRAVLVLRDSLDWSAEEVAELLGMSTTAVHSALVRARETLKARGARRQPARPPGRQELALARRFGVAYARHDIDALVTLLREDIEIHMPPAELWIAGRDEVLAFLPRRMWPLGPYELALTRANGAPAILVAIAGRPFGIVALETARGRVARLHAFLLPPLVPLFAPSATPLRA